MRHIEAQDTKVVVFTVGQAEYAVPITAVREVVPWTPPTPVPEAPAIVEGVVDLRGEIIPVVDLGVRFRTSRRNSNEESRIMVMELQGQQAGFVVDQVTEVHSIGSDMVTPPSPILRAAAGAADRVVAGIVKLGDNRLVVLIDAAQILADTKFTQM